MARYEELYVGNLHLRKLFMGPGEGERIAFARGSVAATASASISTGLSTVDAVVVGSEADIAAGANACVLANGKPGVVAGNIKLTRWKHTNSTTNTLVAATTAGTLDWIAVGS
jgi:hypothetical protein